MIYTQFIQRPKINAFLYEDIDIITDIIFFLFDILMMAATFAW